MRALHFALSRVANAYAFTLVIWGTGLIAAWEIGKPSPADVFAFVGGALVSVTSGVVCALGVWKTFSSGEPERRPFSAMHFLSVPAPIAAGWGVSSVVGGPGGFFLCAFVAVGLSQALLALEVALALPGE